MRGYIRITLNKGTDRTWSLKCMIVHSWLEEFILFKFNINWFIYQEIKMVCHVLSPWMTSLISFLCFFFFTKWICWLTLDILLIPHIKIVETYMSASRGFIILYNSCDDVLSIWYYTYKKTNTKFNVVVIKSFIFSLTPDIKNWNK